MKLGTFALASALIASLVLAGCNAPPAGGAAGKSVEMKDTKFEPATLTVANGTKVTWTNRDTSVHTIDSDDMGGPLKSGNVAGGGTYSYTFTKAGTYKYHCTPHASKGADGNYAGMVGTITVTA